MKKLISFVSAICLLLLLVGCSTPEPTPIDNISVETIHLSKPFSVSLTLDANSEVRMPFNLSIDKTAIKVKCDGEDIGEFSISLYISPTETKAATFEINNQHKTATFTNLISSEDFYFVIQNQSDEPYNLVLVFSEKMS